MTYYDKIAKGYNHLHGNEQRKKLNLIKQYIKETNKNKININKSTKLLDVGCGTGLSSDFDCKVIGIDPSKELIKIAKKNYPKKKFIVGVAEKIPFKDNYFDIVISITAVHNFTDIEKGLKEIKRVGKRRFVLSILKKSKKLSKINMLIKKYFNVKKKIVEDKDVIYFLS